MRKLLALAAFLILPGWAFAQGVRVDNPGGPAQKIVQGFVSPIPGATITVCTSSATGTPCTPLVPTSPVTLCTDATCSTAAPNPFTADAGGNYGFWAVPGTYKVSITTSGVTGSLLTVTLPCAAGVSCVANGGPASLTNLTVSGTGTFTGLTGITNAGAFTDSAMDEYFSSKINSPNTQTMFQYFYPPGSFNTAAITGAVVVPVGATKQQATGVHGYVDCASGASGTPCVAVAGYGRVTGTNSHTFGFNTIVADNVATPSTNMFGYENDVNINSASSNAVAQLISGVWTAQCGACYGWVLNKPVAGSGGPYTWTFGHFFQVGATAAPGANNAAIYFNPVASGVNQQSQGMEFVANDPSSGQNLGSFGLLANGNYLASMSKPGAVFQVNAGISANSAAANGALNSVIGTASGLLPTITTTDAAVVADGSVTLGSGTGKTYGVIGVVRANGDASGDKAFAAWFKASAQNTISAEVGLHTETSDTGATLIEAQQGTNKAVLSSTLPTGTSNFVLDTAAQTLINKAISPTANVFISTTAPTIAAAGCGGGAASIVVSNGTGAFKVNVGTTPGSACTITMPAATTGWNCFATDITTNSTSVFLQKQTGAESQTSVTITNFNDVAVATAFVASDILKVSCHAD